MLSEFRNQFKLKNFGYHDCSAQQFYRTEWSEKYRKVFWVWRVFTLCYWLSWFVTGLITYDKSNWWMKLTNWGMVITIIYFSVSFIVSSYEMFSCSKIKPITPHPLRTIRGDFDGESSSVNNSTTLSNENETKLQWFHIVVWVFFELSLGLALIITVSYWILLNPKFNVFSVNNHLINSVILLVDLFINAIPVRLFHFYHLSLCAITYTLFSLTLYGIGYEEAIYTVLNWRTNFGFSLILTLAISLVGAPIFHFIIFLLYSLKKLISQQLTRSNLKRRVLSESDPDPNSPLKKRINSYRDSNINV